MGIDIWEVIEAAKSKPFGYMPFYPGPGLGGHCIPIDPFYLSWRAKQFGQKTRFIELAGEINTAMPNHVVDVLEGALYERFNKNLDGSKILILGVAYKKNVDDVRESPAFAIMELLEGKGAKTAFYDPHVKEIPITREHMGFAGRISLEWNSQTFSVYDAALIVTDHDGVDYDVLTKESLLVIDTRNATRDTIDTAGKIIRD
jgi:UDP-N-acetyl-D-glucosamine dehydrogenase